MALKAQPKRSRFSYLLNPFVLTMGRREWSRVVPRKAHFQRATPPPLRSSSE